MLLRSHKMSDSIRTTTKSASIATCHFPRQKCDNDEHSPVVSLRRYS